MSNEQRRQKLWVVVRVQDYGIAFLAFIEDYEEYGPLSGDTHIYLDREEAYQSARKSGGLLMNADSLPGRGALIQFTRRMEELRTAKQDLTEAEDEDGPQSSQEAQEGQDDVPGVPEPQKPASKPNTAAQRSRADDTPY